MSCWELLGIEPIANKTEIKKAYISQLRQLVNDDKTEDIEYLRAAFEQALLLAEKITSGDSVEKYGEADTAEIVYKVNEEILTSIEGEAMRIFFEQLNQLYNEKIFFADLTVWKKLFADELSWSINERKQIERRIQEFLVENYLFIAKPIIDYLGQVFDFDESEEVVEERTPFSYSWEQIQQAPDFPFDFYIQIELAKRIPYFLARYELYQLLAKGTIERNHWNKKMAACQSMFIGDPAVIHLQLAYTLVKDVKLENEQSKQMISERFAELQALALNETTIFLSDYVDWASNKGRADRLLMCQPDQLPGLPYAVFLLLTGQVYAALDQTSEADARFELLKQVAPGMIPKEPEKIVVNEIKSTHYSAKAVWVVVSMVLLLFSFVRQSERASVYEPTQDLLPETSITSAISDFIELKSSSLMYNNFTYYFYIDREDASGRQKFIEEHVNDDAKAMFLTLDFEKLDSLDLEDAGFLYPTIDNVQDYGQLNGLRFELLETPFVILQMDEDGKINDVFGKGWTELEKQEYDRLWEDMEIRPWTSGLFFLHSFLLTEQREWSLDYHPEFTTEAVKELLNEHMDDLTGTDYHDWTRRDTYDDQKKDYSFFEYKNGEKTLILSYDAYGQIDHIYGEGWEVIDDEIKQQLSVNSEVAERNQ
ncbi:hypothetical protein [Candidatus Enterococcus clewellii]|uniref:J domain-containing protein n=1 Tax=Candidatus Enterococcus clewellii TaxID=1834193 RepID=A0A242JZN0_9ENTE|nr:hypothetical protein [Enterococcus sp. 9E7_DIV0242]OTP10581.1 hypothetical protein A5888_003879 [Enterococcus sp. 9E7_DIV0242]